MILPPRFHEPTRSASLIGVVPGALLAALPIVLALRERGIAVHLSTAVEDPLTQSMSRALAARAIAHELASAPPDAIPVLVGDGALLDHPIARDAREDAWLAIVGLGAEACAGHDPARAHQRLMACLAEGELVHRAMLHPFDPQVRTWLEIVEDVHQAVGPAHQQPIVDAMRAALMGRHGRVAVNVAARERPAIVGLETATISWVRAR